MHPNYSISTVNTLRSAARVTACVLASRTVGVWGDLTY